MAVNQSEKTSTAALFLWLCPAWRKMAGIGSSCRSLPARFQLHILNQLEVFFSFAFTQRVKMYILSGRTSLQTSTFDFFVT